MAQQPQDVKASLSTPRTPAQPTTPTTQATQTTTTPTTPVAASTEATQKKTIVVDTAPTPSETKVDNTIKYSFDDNTNTYLKTVKYLVDNFSGKVIPLETVGMSMTMNAWQAVKNIIIKTKDENFTSVMDELNKIIISGTGTDKCFADNRIFYYSNSYLGETHDQVRPADSRSRPVLHRAPNRRANFSANEAEKFQNRASYGV